MWDFLYLLPLGSVGFLKVARVAKISSSMFPYRVIYFSSIILFFGGMDDVLVASLVFCPSIFVTSC